MVCKAPHVCPSLQHPLGSCQATSSWLSATTACTTRPPPSLTLSPQHPAGGKPEAASTHSSKVSLSELLSFRGARIGVILFLLQQFSGINAVIYFSTKVFAQVTTTAHSLLWPAAGPGAGPLPKSTKLCIVLCACPAPRPLDRWRGALAPLYLQRSVVINAVTLFLCQRNVYARWSVAPCMHTAAHAHAWLPIGGWLQRAATLSSACRGVQP